jgi:hypothetical protein
MDKITEQLSQLPQEIKDHQIIQNKKDFAIGIKRKHRIIKELKADCLKQMHLTQINSILKISKPFYDLQIQELLELDLTNNEKKISDVIREASSQMVLENMLSKIKEFWQE